MDQKDSVSLPGFAPFCMLDRGMTESLPGTRLKFQELRNVNFSNASVDHNSNMGRSTSTDDRLNRISPHNVNMGEPTPAAVSSSQNVGRKRGRTRTRGDGLNEAVALGLNSSPATYPGTTTSTRKRGRGQGGGRKQQQASFGNRTTGTAGKGFIPHVITVSIGDDVAMKIRSFAQQAGRALCIMAATGAVSCATLCVPSTGNFVRYEGRFEIICLSGSYLLNGDGDSSNQTGGLTVCVSSHDGRVVGGILAGMLIAATPVQIILGSFLWGNSKIKQKKQGDEQSGKDLQHETAADGEVAAALGASTLNVTVSSSSGMWPSPGSLDMQDEHVDIDLMR